MRIRKVLLVVGLVAVVVVAVFAGKQVLQTMGVLDPPTSPGATSSYTLEDIYNRLASGAAGTQSTFTEPTTGPGTGTMHTLNEIMGVAPARDDANGATAADVAAGKEFWGLNVSAGEWGKRTGTNPPCVQCTGTLDGTRWCDNGDGTVTDMTTGLVWLKDASWGGQWPWRDPDGYDDAHTRASYCGEPKDDWRLPTYAELDELTHGTEPVLFSTPRAFTGVQSGWYWTSTSCPGDTHSAYLVDLGNGGWTGGGKTGELPWVWPVRGGQ